MAIFDIYLIKPTRYDDEGYPVQWWRSAIPSNSLACVAALAEDAKARGVLGEGVEIVVHAVDEVNARAPTAAIIARARTPGARVLVMLVGVQTNQYPRALDLARPLRAAGVAVCIGGFHVSGCMALLGEAAPELALARELGLSLFAGEAEDGRLDAVLRDAYAGALRPIYNHLADLPSLSGAPAPFLKPEILDRSIEGWSSFDLGRGCPFECSFCTIINVQGRKSRFRDADDLEAIIRENHANGVHRFFVTDDNLARNRNWEAYADRLIFLAESENIKVRLIIQVDTMAHRIPRFIDKMYRAGAHLVFIGLENINPDNLESVKKRQNRIEEYREMLLAWKIHGVVVICGYIIGFPADTKASILRDIDIIKRELPIDLLYLNFLTPLPGCEDHKRLQAAGGSMDDDFNKYDLNHRVSHHPVMSDAEWESAYWEAHKRFYSHDHMARVFQRMMQMRTNQPFTTLKNLVIYREGPRTERVAFSEFGLWRITHRRDRRHGLPIEHPLIFYPRQAARLVWKLARYAGTYMGLRISLARARMRHRAGKPYVDAAIAPAAPNVGVIDALVLETAARSTPVARKRQERRLAQQLESTTTP
jgi:radical SAM superfamily enzyme YgiQ (UPF0313 family)